MTTVEFPGNPYHLLRYFAYDHLPPHLQEVSKPFHDLAHKFAGGEGVLWHPEVDAGLRKLLEAKDCLVRSFLENK